MKTAFRVLLGTVIYVLIVLLAAPFPAAAGLMLTFPTLNGFAFAFARREEVSGMARSMIWMPVLNGALCAGYVCVFLLLASHANAFALAWLLVAINVGLFFTIGFLPSVRKGIPGRKQFRFGVYVTVIGLVLVALAAWVAWTPAAGASGALAAGGPIAGPLSRNAAKIALFALCLTAFLIATAKLPLSDGVRGVLAGLPFVPLGGLVSIAGDGMLPLDTRLAVFHGMAASVWFSPVIPVWFVYGFSHALVTTRAESDGPKLAMLVGAWVLCGLAIAAVAWALSSR